MGGAIFFAMEQNIKNKEPDLYLIHPGYIYVATDHTSISSVLGSCVSVSIHDRKMKIGGMNHFYFPEIKERDKCTAQYGNIATIMLIKMMVEKGSDIKHLEAQIFGGAYNAAVSDLDIGNRNAIVARNILNKKRIPIVSEDVGGKMGRKVVFDTYKNEIAVLKVEKLRTSDWYPYEGKR